MLLEHMCRRLAAWVSAREPVPAGGWTVGDRLETIEFREPEHGRHRIILIDRRSLRVAADASPADGAELAIVGFCGQKRASIAPALLDEMNAVDDALIEEMRTQPHLLSYSSMELTDGNWVNLVTMRGPEGIAHWRAGQRHAAAASDLSPQYYRSIRLHNLILKGSLSSPRLILLRTKYYDFQGARPWTAIREMPLSPDSYPSLLR